MNDHLKEAERLIECLRCSMTAGSWDEYRSALLAHIQRGAVPDGWQVVPKEPTPLMISAFNVQQVAPAEPAENTWAAMLAAAPVPDQFRDAAKMMAEPAEVPMPEPDSECTHQDDHLYPVWNREQMQQYGDAREAAGYARGYRDGKLASQEWLREVAQKAGDIGDQKGGA